jgi:hypothetical protein
MIGRAKPKELGEKPASVLQEVAGFKPKNPRSEVRNRNERKTISKKRTNQKQSQGLISRGEARAVAPGPPQKEIESTAFIGIFASLESRKISLYFLLLYETEMQLSQPKFVLTGRGLHIIYFSGASTTVNLALVKVNPLIYGKGL